jgi:hypothetical protein
VNAEARRDAAIRVLQQAMERLGNEPECEREDAQSR